MSVGAAAHDRAKSLLTISDMCTDSAVEPTKSENITVTWRRSARSSGEALVALGAVATSAKGALTNPYLDAEQRWHRVS